MLSDPQGWGDPVELLAETGLADSPAPAQGGRREPLPCTPRAPLTLRPPVAEGLGGLDLALHPEG